MSPFCPNINDPKYKELAKVLNDDLAHKIYNANKGNPIDMAPNGQPSILFNTLIKYLRSRDIAIAIKSNIYWSAFTKKYGEWYNNAESVSDKLDVNGEPRINIGSGYKLQFLDNNGAVLSEMDLRPVFDTYYNQSGGPLSPTHPDPKIQADIDKYGKDVITDWNNSYVWAYENKHKLNKRWYKDEYGKRVKVRQHFTYKKAQQIARDIRKDGAIARIISIPRNGRLYYGVEVSVLIGRNPSRYGAELFDVAGVTHEVRVKDVTKIMKTINLINTGKYNALNILKLLMDNFQKDYAERSELKYLFDLISQNEDKLKHIGIQMYTTEEEIDDNTYSELYNTGGTYMDYNSVDDSVRINGSFVMSRPNIEAFIEGLLHEVVHGITERALIEPQDEYDREFRDTIINIYNDALDLLHKNTPKEKLPYGYKNVKEFVSVFMTSDKFASELKSKGKKDNIWHRIVRAFTNLLLKISGKQPLKSDLYSRTYNAVEKFMSKQSQFGVKDLEIDFNKYENPKAESKRPVSDEYYKLSDIAAPGTQIHTVRALNTMNRHVHVEEIEGKRVYIDNNTGAILKGVHEFMQDYGYEYSGKAAAPEALKRAINIGQAVHMYFENKSKPKSQQKDIQKETGYILHKKAKEQLDSIYEEYIATSDVKVLSESAIYDPEIGLAGTADVLSVNKEGNVLIWDYKTSARGFMYYRSGKAPTMQDRYRFQLSLYKHMIEKALHRKVASMNILMLKYSTYDNEIQRVDIDNSYDVQGVDRWFSEVRAVKRTYGEDQMQFTTDNRVVTAEEKARAEQEFYNTKDYNEEEVNDIVKKLDKILDKIKDRFDKRLEVMRRRYPYSIRKQFEEFMEELEKKTTTTESVISIVKYAHESVKALYDQYKKALSTGTVTIDLLARWREYASVYDVLDQLQNILVGEEDLFSDPLVINLLDSTIKLKNKVESLYETEGIDMLAKFLSKYYNGIRNTFKEKLESEYRREVHKLKRSGIRKVSDIINRLGTMGEYVDKEMQKYKLSLDERTEDLLRKELVKASHDVSQIQRWLDNLLDTADPVGAAVVNAFVEADDTQRNQAYEKRKEILDELRSLEKQLNKGKFQSTEEFYSFVLEHEKDPKTGKMIPTQYRVRPWVSELVKEEQSMRRNAYKMYDSNEANAIMRRWRNENMPLDKTAFNKALYEFAYSLYKDGVMGIDEVEKIETFVINGFKTVQQLAKDGNITDEAANQLIGWINDNRLLFSSLAEKWVNPEWDVLMKRWGISTDITYYEQMQLIHKSTHPEARWYSYIDQLDEEANRMLPFNYRLNGRLPGVAKTTTERVKSKQSLSIIARNTFDAQLFLRPEQVERGEHGLQYEDEQGNVKYFLPIHYTNKIELDNQSFDIAGIYFRFWQSANDYRVKREILPQIELAKHLIDKRTSIADRQGRRLLLQKLATAVGTQIDDKKLIKEGKLPSKERTAFAEMFNDWFEMAVYGRKSTDKSLVKWFNTKKEFDIAKFADLLNRYTSLNLLSFNMVQGVANVAIGETMEAIEALAGEYVNPKTLIRATAKYVAMLPAFLGNVAKRNDTSLLGLLTEHWDILHDTPVYTNFDKITKVAQALSSDTLFIFQKSGEHWMQARFMLAMLMEKKAYDRGGKQLPGSMLDYYYVKDGKLAIKNKVDLRKSQWTEVDQESFKRKLKGILSRLHGEYSDLGRIAAQRTAILRMAYMFRKFVVPGFKRRWGRKQYIERLGQTVEGNYLTFGRFMGQLTRDMFKLKFALMAEDWSSLSMHEKANVKRTVAELSFLFAAIIIANMLFKAQGDTDDPDEERWLAFLAYQAYRLKAELTFFVLPGSAMQILRSPMASMSVLENLGRLSIQLLNPTELYQRGPWKGQPKIKKDFIQLIPMYRQYYRLRDISQMTTIFKTANIGVGKSK